VFHGLGVWGRRRCKSLLRESGNIGGEGPVEREMFMRKSPEEVMMRV
jgi:hypothetical protein